LTERLNNLTATSRIEMAVKTKELQETKEKLTSLQKKSNDQALLHDNETKKFEKERNTFQEKMKNMTNKLKEVRKCRL